jgi:quercetin dioxygenase-like cupin family protein
MKRAAALGGLVLAFVSAMYWTGRAQQDDPRFTGKSDTMDAKDLGIGRRSFEPGARSAWHSHDKGQLIFVEQGRARTQKKGQPMKELGVGESDYTAPNVVHWHGATPRDRLVQVAVSFGGEIKWLQKTTDAEYNGR